MKLFWFILSSVLVLAMFAVRPFDDPYGRSINGDGKGYYAYLPAIFIYGDSSYGFIDSIEKKYYPSDGSQFKNFLNEQPNGRYVNKTFPGLSLLYVPFFLLAYCLSAIFGFPLDGYSALFQWGIAFSHVTYFLLGAYFLFLFFRRLNMSNGTFRLVILSLCFASNCWYYIVYDHSVSHVHSFFLACVLLYMLCRSLQGNSPHIFGWILLLMSVIINTRPTNALMILFYFFLAHLMGISIKEHLIGILRQWKVWISYVFLTSLVFMLPLLLWKWQSGYWLVYSYGDEGFDFIHPHFFEFLFSFKKGWFLWSPWVLVLTSATSIYLFLRSRVLLFWYLLPIFIAVYILSSWWCWTFGTGFGQRPMIEFLPFIGIAYAVFLEAKPKLRSFVMFLLLPFIALSFIQGYQINNSILEGGETSREDYFRKFLQVRRDAPSVDKRLNKFIGKRYIANKVQQISQEGQFSSVVMSDSLAPGSYVIVRVKVSGQHKDRDLRLVVSSANGDYYKAFFLGEYLYSETRMMEFLVKINQQLKQAISAYIWNGGSSSQATVNWIEIDILNSNSEVDALLSVLNEKERIYKK